jgi:hypothetical protein
MLASSNKLIAANVTVSSSHGMRCLSLISRSTYRTKLMQSSQQNKNLTAFAVQTGNDVAIYHVGLSYTKARRRRQP